MATWFWLLGGVAVPGLIITGAERDQSWTFVLALQLAILVYAATRLAMLIGRSEPRIMAATFWMFAYVAMGLAPLAQIVIQSAPVPAKSSELLTPATIMVALALVCADAGYAVSSRRLRKYMAEPVVRPARIVSMRRLEAFTVVSVLAALGYVALVGGVGAFFVSREALASDLLGGAAGAAGRASIGLLQAFGQVPVLVSCMCWSYVLVLHGRRARAYVWLWWSVTLLLNAIVNNPVANARFWVVTGLVAAVFVLPNLSGRRYRATIIGGVLGATVLFPFADYFRYTDTSRARQNHGLISNIANHDFDQQVMTANGMWWIDQRGSHTWGAQSAGAVFFFVPRAIWDTKPLDTGIAIGTAMDPTNNGTNLSSPIWLEAWVDFGWPGVIVVMGALGYLSGRADTRFISHRRQYPWALTKTSLLLPLLAGYTFIVLRGPLLQATGRIFAMLASVLWLCGGMASGSVRLSAWSALRRAPARADRGQAVSHQGARSLGADSG